MLAEKAQEWAGTTTGEWVKSYIEYGFAVFPCQGIKAGKCTCGKDECPNAGKHPYTRHGVKDATNDFGKAAVLFNYRDDLNIAIATGAPSGFFVVDVDNRGDISGEDSLRDLQDEHGMLPQTMVSVTGSGRHLMFKMPDCEIKNTTELAPKVDVRGTGGYIIAPPSTHHSGVQYRFDESGGEIAQAPDWLVSLLSAKRKKPVKPIVDTPYTADGWSRKDVDSMLAVLDPDMPYDDWLHVGMALQQGGYPLSMWDSWSRDGQKYENGDCEKRWRGFDPNSGITMGTLVDMAMLRGWKPELPERPQVDTSNVDGFVNSLSSNDSQEAEMQPESSFPFDPLELPGLIGDTVRAITKYALYKQPELAYINTLAAAGAVFGRRYASPMNARTNIYMVGVARTAGGKDFSRQYISNLFEMAGLQEYLGAHYIRSDVGMLVSMQSSPSQVIMLDEFGMYMEALANQRAPVHIKNVTSCLTKLFTSSGTFYDHGATADSKTRIIIQRPNLCIYGTTTEETYASSLRRAAIASGDLNRFLVYKSTRKFTGREARPPAYQIEKLLVNEWKKYALSDGGLPNLSAFPPEPVVVDWSNEVFDMVTDCAVKQNDILNNPTNTSELWGRYAELVTKIAMILAIGENRLTPAIVPSHMQIARATVDTCMNYMVSLANERVADSDYESVQQQILRYLRRFRGGVSMSELNQQFRSVKSRERREVLADMVGQGVIEIARVPTGDGAGRPREMVRASKP